jgi:hypothetical protein
MLLLEKIMPLEKGQKKTKPPKLAHGNQKFLGGGRA